MGGITIEDEDREGVLIHLKKVLETVGERALNSSWVLSGVEALGEQAADELHRLSDGSIPVDGRALLELVSQTWQVIDGKFDAFEEGHEFPWIAIYAVDSTAYDIVTNDDVLLEGLRSSFQFVKNLPESAYTWPPKVDT